MADNLVGYQLLAVCTLDAMAGDPRWLPHPVRMMGIFILQYERQTLARLSSPLSKRGAGLVLAVAFPVGCFLMTQWIMVWAEQVHELFGMVAWVVVGSTTVAGRDLWDHARRVHEALGEGGVLLARVEVGRLVGRDTETLSEAEIVRATVESVSENTSDGIVAPLLYLAVGGPALAIAYKAINTLDSMVGYRTDRYREFGWASARLDDVVNWLPARVTALAISVAASIRLGTGRASWRICWRDARQHPSPNSGWPEAAMAGALGVQLGGCNWYDGVAEPRATLGDPQTPLCRSHIPAALQVMVLACGILVIILFGCMMW